MPKPIRHIPKLCRHARGQAFVKLSGRQIWLGRYGDAETRERYDRVIAEWLANGRELPPEEMEDRPNLLTITELVDAYWQHCKGRYGRGEADPTKSVLRVVRGLYGSTDAVSFGPKRLRAVRAEMIKKGWTRRSINRHVSRIRSMMRWAVSHEMLPEVVYRRLATVEPLRRGEAPEAPRVLPVPRHWIRQMRRHVSPQVRALVDLQLLTGARAGELLKLRPVDIDAAGDVWFYTPAEHKTAHHEKSREIYFGPRAQRILHLFMRDRRVDAYLFSPREAEELRYSKAPSHRRPGQRPNPRKTARVIGEYYTVATYRRALHRGADAAFPPPADLKSEAREQWRSEHRWGPHRLRHNAGTHLRRQFGLEMSRVILGHSHIKMTELYSEVDREKAIDVIRKIG